MRAGKGFTSSIPNQDMNDTIKLKKSLEDSKVLIGGITKTVKHEIKTKTWISSYFVSTLSRFISTTSKFFSSIKCKWKKS